MNSSSSPWTNAPQAPLWMRETDSASRFSHGLSSAQRAPLAHSPDVTFSQCLSWAERLRWNERNHGKFLICLFLPCYQSKLTLISDMSFLSRVCSRKCELTRFIEPNNCAASVRTLTDKSPMAWQILAKASSTKRTSSWLSAIGTQLKNK